MPTSREVERPSVRSERAVDNTDPRTRIESDCERGTNVSKLLLPVDALVQNEVYKTAKDLKGINSC
ncbi:hypothetical protein PROFUN_15676 [Planoprotostelium fungivorum]|uniref:Uncharacterized protein n=1 Tax=Planoprotostelium fungivorum TaxID=1890364 RepID=A0A2P6MV29_9EUKA|nr:hypothetical protein PROFUN_15676 [Planoprotostelium fungivorum]